jgi:hypothetical protein
MQGFAKDTSKWNKKRKKDYAKRFVRSIAEQFRISLN